MPVSVLRRCLFSALAFIAQGEYLRGMDIIAHRGYSGAYPENTMLAFRKAVEAGADAIELDVHLSRDGEVMIMHDEALMRTAGREGCVSDYTRSELEKISAGRTKDDIFGFTPIPSLEEYLSMISQTGLYTNIEFKTAPVYYPGIEEKVIALISRFGVEKKVLFSSFNWLTLFRLRTLAPGIPAGFLFDGMKLRNIGREISDAGFECYHPSFRILDDECVRELHDNGVRINVWTVNTSEEMIKAAEWGIDGLITNEPEKARSAVGASRDNLI